MTDTEISALLAQVLDLLVQNEASSTFDFEQALLGLGCTPAEAEILADYIPSACGRAFLREIGIIPSDTYRRPNKDGSWGPPQRFSNDPMWRSVENFVESLRTSSMHSRRQFSLAAQHGAEVGVVNKAMNAGQTLADLRGSRLATVFVAPLKYS
jgi:hypothetical protein